MINLQEMIKDIKSLRGATVEIFGQKTVLDKEVSEMYIDILDIMESLVEYEQDLEVEEYDEETEEYEVKEVDTIDEYLDFIGEVYGLKEVVANNSYNWNGRVSNHFDFKVYKDETLGDTYIVFKVHRYGDVRCNYTKECLLEFDCYDEFLDVITEANKFVTVEVDGKEYDLYVNVTNDGYEVYDVETGKYVGYACETDKESIIEEIREMLR